LSKADQQQIELWLKPTELRKLSKSEPANFRNSRRRVKNMISDHAAPNCHQIFGKSLADKLEQVVQQMSNQTCTYLGDLENYWKNCELYGFGTLYSEPQTNNTLTEDHCKYQSENNELYEYVEKENRINEGFSYTLSTEGVNLISWGFKITQNIIEVLHLPLFL
jgi:hypothetical protein